MNNMIELSLSLLFAVSCGLNAYAVEPSDTIKVLENSREIVVTRSGSTTKVIANTGDEFGTDSYFVYEVEVSENDTVPSCELPDLWGVDLPFFSKKVPSSIDRVSTKVNRSIVGFEHLYWGWRFNYNDKGKVKNGFEIGVRNLIGVSWQRGEHSTSFSIGAGFGMMRILAQDGFAYSKMGDAVTLDPVAEGVKVDKSRLDVWRFHIPVLVKIPIGKECKFSLGGVVDFNTYAKAVTQLYEGDIRNKTIYKGFQQNMLTADLFASFSIGGFGVYATWSPFDMFRNGYGPELKGWSIGVDLFTF